MTLTATQIGQLAKYRPTGLYTAVRIPVDSEGIHYTKWGGQQFGKPGDFLVHNLTVDEVYTVDYVSFTQSFEASEFVPGAGAAGIYRKKTFAYAVQATEPGIVETKEGATNYFAGDYIVANNPDGSDAWAMSAEKFVKLYEAVQQ